MRVFRISFATGIVLALSLTAAACSTYQPRPNPWPAQKIAAQPPTPEKLPPWPRITSQTLTAAQLRALEQYARAAQANYQIANELSKSVGDLIDSHNALVEAGSAEHQLAEMREAELQQERQSKLWDRVLWLGLGLLSIGHR